MGQSMVSLTPRPRLVAPLPEPAAHLALATTFSTEREQSKLSMSCRSKIDTVYVSYSKAKLQFC